MLFVVLLAQWLLIRPIAAQNVFCSLDSDTANKRIILTIYKTPCNDDLMLLRMWPKNHCHNNLTITECFSSEWKLSPAAD